MASPEKDSPDKGLPESLRTAIERTFEATGSSGAARERAGELVDEVSRRGREARDAVSRRGQKASEASADAASKVIDALEGMRVATREEVRDMQGQIDVLAGRVADLEVLATRVAALESKPNVEG